MVEQVYTIHATYIIIDVFVLALLKKTQNNYDTWPHHSQQVF